MATSTQSKRYVGTDQPIVIEFTYEEWRRLSRLSNIDDKWMIKFYNAIFRKAGLREIGTEPRVFSAPRDYAPKTPAVQEIVCGYRAYSKYEAIFKKKYTGRGKEFINFDVGPSNVLHPGDPSITPDQILVRPIAFGSNVWNKNDFR